MNFDVTTTCVKCGGVKQRHNLFSRSPTGNRNLCKVIDKLTEEIDALYKDHLNLDARWRETEEKLVAEQEYSHRKDQRILHLEKKLNDAEQLVSQRLSEGLKCGYGCLTGRRPTPMPFGTMANGDADELKTNNSKKQATTDIVGFREKDKESDDNSPDKLTPILSESIEDDKYHAHVLDHIKMELSKASVKIQETQEKNEQLELELAQFRNSVSNSAQENFGGPSFVLNDEHEQTTQQIRAENEQLKRQFQHVFMLVGEWQQRYKSMERKMGRLQQIITVLQDGTGLDLNQEPALFFPPEVVEVVDYPLSRRRFRSEICHLEECKNCRRFLSNADFDIDLCLYHSGRPLSMTEWQILFPGIQVSMYKDHMFWPCCNKLARKAPEGCTINQHEKMSMLEAN